MQKLTIALLTIALLVAISDSVNAQVVLTDDNEVGMGTETPDRAVDIVGTVRIADLPGFPAVKHSLFCMRHYDDEDRDFVLLYGSTDSTRNVLNIGGGHKKNFAASEVNVFTTHDTQLRNGKVRVHVAKNGNVGIGTIQPPYLLTVNGTAGKPGGGVFIALSDRNSKTDVRKYDKGLEAVLELKPYRFRYKKSSGMPTDREYIGVMAQDFQKVAPDAVQSCSFYDPSGKESEMLTVDASEITYMLVQAVQEMHRQRMQHNTETEERISVLEQKIKELQGQIACQGNRNSSLANSENTQLNKGSILLSSPASVQLSQNRPNPATHETLIDYTVPDNFQEAAIIFYDIAGRFINSYPIEVGGKGQLLVDCSQLPGGVYLYTLKMDGEHIQTQKMIVKDW